MLEVCPLKRGDVFCLLDGGDGFANGAVASRHQDQDQGQVGGDKGVALGITGHDARNAALV